jgi:hypothetical protein
VLALIGAALVALGSLLPWATVDLGIFGTIEKAGTEGDGLYTLIAAGIAAALAVWGWRRPGRDAVVGTVVIAGLITMVCAYDVVDVSSTQVDGVRIETSVGIGLWFALVGAIALLVAAVMRLLDRRAPTVPPPPRRS